MKRAKAMQMAELARQFAKSPQPEEKDVKTSEQQSVRASKQLKASTGGLRVADRSETSSDELHQMTIKLDMATRDILFEESLRRKKAKAQNWPVRNIVTEAVNKLLGDK